MPCSTPIAAGDPIILPPSPEAVDFEAAGFVVGRRRRAGARDGAGGRRRETVANDVTMRDYQYKTHQWLQVLGGDSTLPGCSS